jgi:hypothetical protein
MRGLMRQYIQNKGLPHFCDKPGIPCNCDRKYSECNDWGDRSDDMTDQLVWAGVNRLTMPLSDLSDYMARMARDAAQEDIPTYGKDCPKYAMWEDDISNCCRNMTIHVAARLALGIPTRWTTLEETLQAAMVNAGLCCEEAVNHLIEEELGPVTMKQLLEICPGFKKEWVTIQGYKDIPVPWNKPKVEV